MYTVGLPTQPPVFKLCYQNIQFQCLCDLVKRDWALLCTWIGFAALNGSCCTHSTLMQGTRQYSVLRVQLPWIPCPTVCVHSYSCTAMVMTFTTDQNSSPQHGIHMWVCKQATITHRPLACVTPKTACFHTRRCIYSTRVHLSRSGLKFFSLS